MYDLGGGNAVTCGFSLVMGSSATESDIVITAAHWVMNLDRTDRVASNFTLIFGNHDNRFWESQEQRIRIKKFILNTNFKANATSDIAVIKLKTPVKFNNYIRPICMATAGQMPKDKTSCITVGCQANSNANSPNRLQQVKYPMLDDKMCGSSEVWDGKTGLQFDDSSMTCAGVLDGSVSSCQGDSGGPLACFENGHWTMYDVTSFGNGEVVNNLTQCAAKNKPTIYARVSALRGWIDKSINDLKNV